MTHFNPKTKVYTTASGSQYKRVIDILRNPRVQEEIRLMNENILRERSQRQKLKNCRYCGRLASQAKNCIGCGAPTIER